MSEEKDKFGIVKYIVIFFVGIGLSFVGNMINDIIKNPQKTIQIEYKITNIEEKVKDISNKSGVTDANVQWIKEEIIKIKTILETERRSSSINR